MEDIKQFKQEYLDYSDQAHYNSHLSPEEIADWWIEKLILAVKQEREKFDTILAEKVERIEKRNKEIGEPGGFSESSIRTWGIKDGLDLAITILKD